jgi:hypothetical protein
VPTFADKGCGFVSVADPHGRTTSYIYKYKIKTLFILACRTNVALSKYRNIIQPKKKATWYIASDAIAFCTEKQTRTLGTNK